MLLLLNGGWEAVSLGFVNGLLDSLPLPNGLVLCFLLLGAVLADGLDAVEAACAEALGAGLFSRDVVLNVLARRREPATAASLASIGPRLTIEPVADCARYDELRTMRTLDGAP